MIHYSKRNKKDKPTLIHSFDDDTSSLIELKTQKNSYATKGGGGVGREDKREEETEKKVGRKNFSQFC